MALQIKIINGDCNTLCQTKCGTNWSSPDIRTQVTKELKERYGNSIKIEYTRAEVRDSNKGPILMLNGQIWLTDQFDTLHLIEIIETELELGA